MLKLIAILVMTATILWYITFKTSILVKTFRVVLDLRDQATYNTVMDTLASASHMVEARYRETTDTIIIDIWCLFFIYSKLRKQFSVIPNTEVY